MDDGALVGGEGVEETIGALDVFWRIWPLNPGFFELLLELLVAVEEPLDFSVSLLRVFIDLSINDL